MDKNMILSKIANTLYINMQQVKQYGLLQGRLGIAIFFYHYARYIQDESYNDLPNEYIKYLFARLGRGNAESFADGLSGIGWGIDYVIRNGFIKANDDMLDEVDAVIENLNLSDFVKEIALPIPLFSKGLYFLQRKNRDALKATILQTKDYFQNDFLRQLPVLYMNSITYVLKKCVGLGIETGLCNGLLKKLHLVTTQKTGKNEFLFNLQTLTLTGEAGLLNKLPERIPEIVCFENLSIYNGLAGMGLSLMNIHIMN
jgi:lantibiotic modifying enzyme